MKVIIDLFSKIKFYLKFYYKSVVNLLSLISIYFSGFYLIVFVVFLTLLFLHGVFNQYFLFGFTFMFLLFILKYLVDFSPNLLFFIFMNISNILLALVYASYFILLNGVFALYFFDSFLLFLSFFIINFKYLKFILPFIFSAFFFIFFSDATFAVEPGKLMNVDGEGKIVPITVDSLKPHTEGYPVFNQRSNSEVVKHEFPHIAHLANTLPDNHAFLPMEFLSPNEHAIFLHPDSTSSFTIDYFELKYKGFKGILLIQARDVDNHSLNWYYLFCNGYTKADSMELTGKSASLVDNFLGDSSGSNFVKMKHLDKQNSVFTLKLADGICLNSSNLVVDNIEFKFCYDLSVESITRSSFKKDYPGVTMMAYSQPSNAFRIFPYNSDFITNYLDKPYDMLVPPTSKEAAFYHRSSLLVNNPKIHPDLGLNAFLSLLQKLKK